MKKRSWELETSGRMEIAEALWETEGKAMTRRKGTAPNLGRGGGRGRGMDDFSAENVE